MMNESEAHEFDRPSIRNRDRPAWQCECIVEMIQAANEQAKKLGGDGDDAPQRILDIGPRR
jgi:hypothetical protein